MNCNNWKKSLSQKTDELQHNGLERKMRPMDHATEPRVTLNGIPYLNLSSNNYLGLANHPSIATAMTGKPYPSGAASSRLVIGHDTNTEHLEAQIAHHKHTEKALLFSNGYMANIGVLSSILRPKDTVFSDQFNHASIVDGIRLSGAKHYRYRHNTMDHLETLLKKESTKKEHRKLIVTETVFSMDGDIAPLSDILFLKKKYGAALMTDDAHGDGVFGNGGAGVLHHLKLNDEVDLQMGTFSKAFGVYGAYVAGSQEWIAYLIHTCRSLIYTTALPPALIHGIRAALPLVQEGEALRRELAKKTSFFRTTLQQAGFHILGETHIIPIVIGDEKKTLSFSEELMKNHILGVAIRPPTVPKGTSRIRLTLMANHPWDDIKKALPVIIGIGKELKIIP